ncbi:hypothetical protein VTJ49DRAFT_2238 [Mycothermus thermophilus]|uniref:Inosine/uridine-preferring nucleoside hydrolase domain-containing protein n=1 Tax=Humicola insolens TaxID=85995 RepID=A0ABR3VAN4_HUMIN
MTNLIVDTDIYSDVDDAAALLLATTLPDANLLAVNVNYTSSYSALAVSAILGHYNKGHVPIGIRRPLTDDTFFDIKHFSLGEFASKVAFHFRDSGGSLPWGRAEEAWDPVQLYRKTLAEAEDGSVTVVSIGFLDNLSALLSSPPDTHSPLPGAALISLKVSHLVVMGGAYPTSTNPDTGTSHPSWNFSGPNGSHAPAAAHVVSHWPGRVTFLGREVGANVIVGGPLMGAAPGSGVPRRDPVRMAYLWYTYGGLFDEDGDRRKRGGPAWDPLAVLYAVREVGCGLFEDVAGEGRRGWCVVDEKDGGNRWVWEDEGGGGDDHEGEGRREHAFLSLKVSPEGAAEVVDELLLKGARSGGRGSFAGGGKGIS